MLGLFDVSKDSLKFVKHLESLLIEPVPNGGYSKINRLNRFFDNDLVLN